MNEHAIDDDIKDGWILIANKKGVRLWRKNKTILLISWSNVGQKQFYRICWLAWRKQDIEYNIIFYIKWNEWKWCELI